METREYYKHTRCYGLLKKCLSKVTHLVNYVPTFWITFTDCKDSIQIDFVFYSYMNDSVKDSERIRRCNCSPVDLNQVSAETKLPVVMDAFLGSTTNKIKLQNLLRD